MARVDLPLPGAPASKVSLARAMRPGQTQLIGHVHIRNHCIFSNMLILLAHLYLPTYTLGYTTQCNHKPHGPCSYQIDPSG
jgi:hypothetical protein